MAANNIVHHHTGKIVDPRFFTPNGLMLPRGPKAILGFTYKNAANMNKKNDIDHIKWFCWIDAPIINSLPKINVILHFTRP